MQLSFKNINFDELIKKFLYQEKDIYPLITFRITFGLLMCIAALRTMWNGWIEKLYVEPQYFFKFYGFEWVQVLSLENMYLLYIIIAISAFFVAIGFFYRISIFLFFLSFTYVELIDATNYLNHYYLVILLSFLMIFIPAHQYFSIDNYIFKNKKTIIPAWCIHIIIAQLCMVYFFAGFAKLHSDWLFNAMPLAIWLPEKSNIIPFTSFLFEQKWFAFFFSWCGAFYDLTIWVFLLIKKTRPIAYIFVIIFHLMTWALFNIGYFPLIMITSTLIFFSSNWHQKMYYYFINNKKIEIVSPFLFNKNIQYFIGIYLMIQILLPFRHLIYGGNVLWHEQGYRFSWRVMLVEKNAKATFYIEDESSGQKSEVLNSKYLTDFQEKQMSIQADFILQFAQIIAKDYQSKYNIKKPKVTADVYVALNGRTSKKLIDSNINLLDLKDGFKKKDWILKFQD